MQVRFLLCIFCFLPLVGCISGKQPDADKLLQNLKSTPTPSSSNNAPTITSIESQTTEIGVHLASITFSIDEGLNEDAQTASVVASSSNLQLLPLSAIQVHYADNGAADASDVTAWVDLYPNPGVSGQVTVTLTVIDNGTPTRSANSSFELTLINPLENAGGNMTLWLRADAGTFNGSCSGSLSSNLEAVNCWKDQSGMGFDVTATATTTPVLQTNAANLNSQAALLFDGIDDQMSNSSVAHLLAGDDRPLSAFIVFKFDTVANASSTLISF